MDAIGWLAVVCAGFAVWIWLPPDGVKRLRPGGWLALPRWAEPLPAAMDSTKRWWISGVAGAGVVAYGWNLSHWVLLVAPVVVVGAWIGLGRLEPASARRKRVEIVSWLPQALDLLGVCVRAGQPLRNAVETVAQSMGPPISDLFGAVTNAISVGMSDSEAWGVLRGDPVVGSLARDMARSTDWGTTVTDILAQHSADLRRQGGAERLAAAKAVGVKSVLPLGLCYLPAFVLLGVVPVVAAGLSGFFS